MSEANQDCGQISLAKVAAPLHQTHPIVAKFQRVWLSPVLMTWFSFATKTLGILLLMPILVACLPKEEVAVWLLLVSLVSLQSLADFGFGPTFTRIIGYALGGIQSLDDIAPNRLQSTEVSSVAKKPNEELLESITTSMFWIYARLSLVAMIVIGIAGTFLLNRLISYTASPLECWIAWGMVAAMLYLTFWSAFLGSYMQGLNEIALFRRWEAAWTTLAITAAAVAAIVTHRFLVVVTIQQIVLAIGVWWNFRIASSLRSQMLKKAIKQKPDSRVLKIVWPVAWRSGVGVCTTIIFVYNAPGFIYAQFAEPGAVVGFVLAMRLMVAISQISQVPFYTKIPLLSRDFASGNLAGVNSRTSRGMKMSNAVFLLSVVGVGFAVPLICQYSKGSVTFIPLSYWFLLSLAFLIERVGSMHIQIYSLSNHIIWHWLNGITCSLFLILSILLWPFFNTWAFPFSMLLAYGLFYTPYASFLSYRLLKKRWLTNEWQSLAFPAISTLAVLALISKQ